MTGDIVISGQIDAHGVTYRCDMADPDVFARWAGAILVMTAQAQPRVTVHYAGPRPR